MKLILFWLRVRRKVSSKNIMNELNAARGYGVSNPDTPMLIFYLSLYIIRKIVKMQVIRVIG